jgi:ribonuclease HI
MKVAAPHFLLFSESRRRSSPVNSETEGGSRWRFVLENIEGQVQLEAEDAESAADTNRLELLAVVRGLESLDEPSRVTLVTTSRYVAHGFRFGLDQWRESGWQWERFGEMAPVKNSDLWRRIDRAMRFHRVECRAWRLDMPVESAGVEHESPEVEQARVRTRRPVRSRASRSPLVAASLPGRWISACGRLCRALVRRCYPGGVAGWRTQAA